MKKLFLAMLLCLFCFLAISCSISPDKCKHNNYKESQHEPTCSLEGYILHTCATCGSSYRSDIVKPLGHKLSSSVTEPTCTDEGYTTYTCSACDYVYETDHKEPTGHTLTSKITPQTCTEEGYTTYSCPCGYTYRSARVIPNGHYLDSTVVPPTCAVDGYTLYACNNCNYQYKADFTSKAHALTETVKAPTCETVGYTLYDCSACDYQYQTSYTPATGHTYTKKVIDPTFSESGYTLHSCKCGFSYKSDFVRYINVFTGKYGNEPNGTVVSRGVDLSYHNKTVNFEKLAADGVDFVILRVGYTHEQTLDSKFEEYYAAARRAGLDIGAYIYSYDLGVDELVTNVTGMLKHLEGKTFEYPIYLDIEHADQKTLSRETLMEMCTAYCDLLVENRYFPGVYSYRNFIRDYMDFEKLSAGFDLWMAHYFTPADMADIGENYYADTVNMWQYTEDGSANGVVGIVDMNLCYKDYPTIIKKIGFNGYPQ